MDAFESLIATLLRRDGYWVETSVKVSLMPEEKHAIGRQSSPRWEIDVRRLQRCQERARRDRVQVLPRLARRPVLQRQASSA
jgi:hypothetical protein